MTLFQSADAASPELPPVFQRFYESLPNKPRATDYLEAGASPCPKLLAIKRRYIQINRQNYWIKYLIYDLDYEGAGVIWNDLNLPAPTFVIINPANGHAHLIYEIESPVHLGGNPSQKAIYYLEVVRRGYTTALKADPAFTGLLSKNPLSSHWRVLQWEKVYDLDRLAEPLRPISWEELHKTSLDDLEAKIKSSKIEFPNQKSVGVGFREEYAARGRNCFCFEHARFFAYEIVKDCKSQAGLERKVKHHIDQLNLDFDERLPASEIRSTSRSIAKWTWNNRDHFIQTRQRFSERQRQRAFKSHESRRNKSEEKIIEAIEKFQREGKRITKAGIARETNISRQSISKYYSHLFKKV